MNDRSDGNSDAEVDSALAGAYDAGAYDALLCDGTPVYTRTRQQPVPGSRHSTLA